MSWYGSHSFLNKYIKEENCKKIMEIGVFNGENARKMILAAMQNSEPEEIEYYGFDLFNGIYGSILEKVKQKLIKIGCKFYLFKGDSLKTLPKEVVNLPQMDIIFIDGDHFYTTVKSDWEFSKTLMHEQTSVFFHNYNYSGPKRVVDNISQEKYKIKIIYPSKDYVTAIVRKKEIF